MKVTRWLRPIHRKSREAKIALFFAMLRPDPSDTLLDVGGGIGVNGEFAALYTRFREVAVLNIRTPHFGAPNSLGVPIHPVLGDACAMPLASRSYDWVFSNAVIEHVGSRDRQKMLADEVRRVARKGYFVTTPSKYFPIELHTLLPLYQFLPVRAQKAVVRVSPGYVREFEPIDLVSSTELRSLFPEATVVGTGLPLIRNSLVAYFSG